MSGLGPYFRSIFDELKQNIPEPLWNSTPLILRATAGMRIIPESDQKEILNTINAIFRTSPFLYKEDWVSVITGDEEAVFAWIAVNYAHDMFRYRDPLQTTGTLDLGGASLQIAFVPETAEEYDSFQVTMAGVDYFVYVESLLNFGLDEFRVQLKTTMAKERGYSSLFSLIGSRAYWLWLGPPLLTLVSIADTPHHLKCKVKITNSREMGISKLVLQLVETYLDLILALGIPYEGISSQSMDSTMSRRSSISPAE